MQTKSVPSLRLSRQIQLRNTYFACGLHCCLGISLSLLSIGVVCALCCFAPALAASAKYALQRQACCAGTTLRFWPGVLVGGADLRHDCGDARSIAYFAEPLALLALFSKKVRNHHIKRLMLSVPAL